MRSNAELAGIAANIVAELVGTTAIGRRRKGAVKWCKRCGRKHGSRERCNLTRNDKGHYVHGM